MKKQEVSNIYIYIIFIPRVDDMDHVNSCQCQPWQELDLYLENSADFFRQLSVRRSAWDFFHPWPVAAKQGWVCVVLYTPKY